MMRLMRSCSTLIYQFVLLSFLGLCFNTSCHSNKMVVSNTAHNKDTTTLLSQMAVNNQTYMPADSTDHTYINLHNRNLVLSLYHSNVYKALWFSNGLPHPLADSMIMLIRNIRYYGLFPQDYHESELATLYPIVDATNLKRCDALLTDAFLSLTQHLKHGRLSNQKLWDHDSIQIELVHKLFYDEGLRKTIQQQEPVWSGYWSLIQAQKLLLDTMEYEAQQKVLDGNTKPLLNHNNELQAIEINLERWRQEKQLPGHRYLLVNIAAYMLEYFDADTLIFTTRVIVGTPDRQTPILSSEIKYFILYPHWYVPRKIAVEEYLPSIKNDASFLHDHNFEVISNTGVVLNPDSIDWTTMNKNNFPVTLRQREGDENALGLVKFIFDNPYSIYLHDTNAPRFFNRKERALSHGCVRVEKAMTMAHMMATGSVTKKSKTIEKYLRNEERHTIFLPQPLPIHIRYFTCEFIKGNFYLYPDVYGKDQLLIDEFYCPWSAESQ